MKRLSLVMIILVLCLFNNHGLWANEAATNQPSMQARFLEQKAELGGTVTLSMECTLPDGAKILEPLEIKGLDDFLILDKKITDKGLKLTLLVNSIDTFKTPPFSLGFANKEGTKQWLDFPSLEIPVDNALPDDPSKMQPRPIKGIIPGKSFLAQYGPWIGGGSLLLALCALGLWFSYKNRRIHTLEIQAAPPHEIALESLDKLEAWWETKGEDKEGYFRLSAIIRLYMGAIRPFPAEDLTTLEIRARIQDKDDRAVLPLLEDADMVKFAGARVAEAARKNHLAAARDYVNTTRPMEEAIQELKAEVVPEKAGKPQTGVKGEAE